jgi:hypothetical protein
VREPLLHHLGDLGRGDEAGRLRGQTHAAPVAWLRD